MIGARRGRAVRRRVGGDARGLWLVGGGGGGGGVTPVEYVATSGPFATGTATLPSHEEGDLLVAFSLSNASTDITISGWVKDAYAGLAWKFAGPSESNPTVTTPGECVLVSFRNVDQGQPFWTSTPTAYADQKFLITATSIQIDAGVHGPTPDAGFLPVAWARTVDEQDFTLATPNGFTMLYGTNAAGWGVVGTSGWTGGVVYQELGSAGSFSWPVMTIPVAENLLSTGVVLAPAGHAPSAPHVGMVPNTIDAGMNSITSPVSLNTGAGTTGHPHMLVAEGDLLVAAIYWRYTTSMAITPPSGWTLRVDQQWSLFGFQVYTKVATAGDAHTANTYQFSWTGTASAFGGSLIGVKGLDTATPLDVAVVQNNGSGTSHTPPSATPVTDGALALAIVGCDDNLANQFVSGSDQGFTFDYTFGASAGSDCSVAFASKTIPTAGSVTAPTFEQLGASSRQWGGALLMIRPAA